VPLIRNSKEVVTLTKNESGKKKNCLMSNKNAGRGDSESDGHACQKGEEHHGGMISFVGPTRKIGKGAWDNVVHKGGLETGGSNLNGVKFVKLALYKNLQKRRETGDHPGFLGKQKGRTKKKLAEE